MTSFDNRIAELREAAVKAAENAWAPYSRFHVGAALLTRKGSIYPGCNVENASFGATCCAERTAIGNAIAHGERDFLGIVIYTNTPRPVAPCGICRQVLLEFGPDIQIASFCKGKDVLRTTSGELVPHAFSGDDFTELPESLKRTGAGQDTDAFEGFDEAPRTEILRPDVPERNKG